MISEGISKRKPTKEQKVKELVERVRLTDEEILKLKMDYDGITTFPQVVAQAQLNKVLNDPDLYIEREALFECSECGQGNFIPLVEALKEKE